MTFLFNLHIFVVWGSQSVPGVWGQIHQTGVLGRAEAHSARAHGEVASCHSNEEWLAK
jgi:hypothetical protein